MEAEAADVRDAPARPPAIGRADCAGCILDNADPAVAHERQDRVHVRRQSERMDGNDGSRAGCEAARHVVRIERECHRIDVRENRASALLDDDVRRRREGEVRNDHLAACADPERHEREVQGRRRGCRRKRISCADEAGDERLELSDLGSLRQEPRRQDGLDLPELVVIDLGDDEPDAAWPHDVIALPWPSRRGTRRRSPPVRRSEESAVGIRTVTRRARCFRSGDGHPPPVAGRR